MPRTMTVTPGNLSLNGTSFFTENHGATDKPSEQRTWNVFLFCFTFALALPALLGSIYSLVSLLKLQNKTTVSLIVTSLAADDLISIVPVIIFMLTQWSSEILPPPLCTTSAFIYLFQGISSNLKGSLIVSYNFYTLSTAGTRSCSSSKRRVSVLWAILTIWTASLLTCILPLCGWGRYIPTSWGCFADCASSYTLFVLLVYSLCLSLLALLAVPLGLRLLCSGELQLRSGEPQLCSGEPQLRSGELQPQHLQGSGASTGPGTPWGCGAAASRDKTLEPFQNSAAVFGKGMAGSSAQSRSFTVGIAQKRFSLILALTKVLLWLPMMVNSQMASLCNAHLHFRGMLSPVGRGCRQMDSGHCSCASQCSCASRSPLQQIQMAVQYITGLQSLLFETLSFLLTLLAATVTPVFVLSQHWLHLPCGCIINCRRNSRAGAAQDAKTKRSGFEFNLSFQQGYGIYRISQEKAPQASRDGKSQSCHSLLSSDCEERGPGTATGARVPSLAPGHGSGGTGTDPPHLCAAGPGACQGQGHTGCEPAAFPGGAEWRMSHQESHTPQLSDWEWCRSKSERNPRQRALAVPLCAFQGTVSLQAPSGKTLSLSTYEVSSEGQKIAPTAQKMEVYRSKSVGHQPSAGEPREGFADTSVRIHLEVLEICDTQEAPDTVSIVSNISQSSQARSPSLRYSRKENRFVSCELGESASFSLLIPPQSPGRPLSISIPDTVEAHRRNSQQQPGTAAFQEDIQLLNTAYRERERQGT